MQLINTNSGAPIIWTMTVYYRAWHNPLLSFLFGATSCFLPAVNIRCATGWKRTTKSKNRGGAAYAAIKRLK